MKKLLLLLAITIISAGAIAQSEVWEDGQAPGTIRAAVNTKLKNLEDSVANDYHKLGGNDLNSGVINPGLAQDGLFLKYDHLNTEYVLDEAGGASYDSSYIHYRVDSLGLEVDSLEGSYVYWYRPFGATETTTYTEDAWSILTNAGGDFFSVDTSSGINLTIDSDTLKFSKAQTYSYFFNWSYHNTAAVDTIRIRHYNGTTTSTVVNISQWWGAVSGIIDVTENSKIWIEQYEGSATAPGYYAMDFLMTSIGGCSSGSGGSMTYPSAGIPLSTGSAWDASITDNSANWNTAYGWGDHSSEGYLKEATGTPANNDILTYNDAVPQWQAVALSGDASILSTGALTISDGAVQMDDLDATGTAGANTVLHGDGSWSAIDLTNSVSGDLPDANVANDITITNISQVQDITATATELNYTDGVTGTTGSGNMVLSTSPTLTTSFTLGSTTIDETELSTIDGTTGYFDADTTFAVLTDSSIVISIQIDSTALNTTTLYTLADLYWYSDSLVVDGLAVLAAGSTVSFVPDVMWNSTKATAGATDLNTSAPTVTSGSGARTTDTTFDNSVIPPDNVIFVQFPTITTTPRDVTITLVCHRQNRSY